MSSILCYLIICVLYSMLFTLNDIFRMQSRTARMHQNPWTVSKPFLHWRNVLLLNTKEENDEWSIQNATRWNNYYFLLIFMWTPTYSLTINENENNSFLWFTILSWIWWSEYEIFENENFWVKYLVFNIYHSVNHSTQFLKLDNYFIRSLFQPAVF